jgi:hypothetical protein
MPANKSIVKIYLLVTTIILIACGLFSAPNPMPAPVQPTDASPPLTDTPTSTLLTLTLPPPSPRPTINSTPAPEWVTDFAEPILAEIASGPPDIEDKFGFDTGAWVLAGWQADWRKSVKNGEMILTGGNVQHQGIKFHDYVIEVKARQVESGWHGIAFANYPRDLRRPPPDQGGFNCSFKVFNTNAHFGCGILGEQTDINQEVTFYPARSFLLIVKGGQIATYLDGQPFGYFEDDRYRLYRGTIPKAGLFSSSVHAFSEFKVWNITKLEMP